MKIIRNYIGSNVLYSMLLASLVLIGLEILINFIGELDDIGNGDYTVWQALIYVLLETPRCVYSLFPMAALIGVLMGLSLLASHSELIVMRTAGVSIARISATVLQVALVIVLFITAIGEIAGPWLKHIADTRKAITTSGGQAVKTVHGTWIRDGQSYIHIEAILPNAQLQGVTRYVFNSEHRLLSVTYAKNAYYQHHHWHLQDVEQSTIHPSSVTTQRLPETDLTISLNPRLLRISQIQPDEMTLPQLRSYVKYREQNGLRASHYNLAFWQRLLQPLATTLMIFLAIPFVFGPLRSATMGLRFIAGICLGFTFYLLNQFFGPMSVVYQFPPALAASIPTFVIGIVALLLMRRVS